MFHGVIQKVLEIWGTAQREAARRRNSDWGKSFFWGGLNIHGSGQSSLFPIVDLLIRSGDIGNQTLQLSKIARSRFWVGQQLRLFNFFISAQKFTKFFVQRSRNCSQSSLFFICDILTDS